MEQSIGIEEDIKLESIAEEIGEDFSSQTLSKSIENSNSMKN